MLNTIAARVAPDAAKGLSEHMLALHKATGESWEGVQKEAAAVRDAATALIPALAKHQFDKADAQVDKSDRLQMRVSLPPLTPGVYKVEWRVMSADTHKVNGNFSFTIGE